VVFFNNDKKMGDEEEFNTAYVQNKKSALRTMFIQTPNIEEEFNTAYVHNKKSALRTMFIQTPNIPNTVRYSPIPGTVFKEGQMWNEQCFTHKKPCVSAEESSSNMFINIDHVISVLIKKATLQAYKESCKESKSNTLACACDVNGTIYCDQEHHTRSYVCERGHTVTRVEFTENMFHVRIDDDRYLPFWCVVSIPCIP